MNKEKLRQENQAIQRRYEQKYFPKVKAAIQSKIDEVASVVKAYGPQAGISFLNKEVTNAKVTAIVQQLALEVGQQFARRQWRMFLDQKRNVKKGFGFNEAWIEWIKNYLFDFIVRKITFSVFETTKDALFRVLNDAIAGGWGIDQTVKALDDLPLSASQAARIVRTEITRAANAGTLAASSTFPYQQTKEWMAAHDTRVRGFDPKDHADHMMMDGMIVDYEDVFRDPRNGDELLFPGDPKASAASTVNCRCSMAVVAKVDENGKLIPKRQSTSVVYPTNRRRTIITI